MYESDDYSFLNTFSNADLDDIVNNNTESVNDEEIYTDYRDYKPYYCGCDPLREFNQLGHFRHHMLSKHKVVIPNKFKRKAEEVHDDSTLKEFKQ